VWLHLGSFGPKRLATSAPSTSTARPFPLVDNAETLLDVSDLVFVDAIGAGLSQAVAPFSNQSFWGVDRDAAAFRDFVARYIEVNARQASPKFLFGESYGTTRSGVLAHLLETAGIALDGVILQSSVLDYNANCGVVDMPTMSCAGYLPTYASTGTWYGLVVPPPVDLGGFRAATEIFTANVYAPAVPAFVLNMMLPPQPVIDTLVADTGIQDATWRTHFNLDPSIFQHALLANAITGRYDARMSAPVGSALAAQDDPSSTFISPDFASAIDAYLRGPLKYSFHAVYTTLGNAIQYWDFGHDGRAVPDVVPDLAAAMALNPRLRVLSVNGFHDLATPYWQTALDLARLGPTPRIAIRNYDGGHMTYLDDGSRVRMKADLRAFYHATPPAARSSP